MAGLNFSSGQISLNVHNLLKPGSPSFIEAPISGLYHVDVFGSAALPKKDVYTKIYLSLQPNGSPSWTTVVVNPNYANPQYSSLSQGIYLNSGDRLAVGFGSANDQPVAVTGRLSVHYVQP